MGYRLPIQSMRMSLLSNPYMWLPLLFRWCSFLQHMANSRLIWPPSDRSQLGTRGWGEFVDVVIDVDGRYSVKTFKFRINP